MCRARDRKKNFGFVTFCRRSSAASAIENVDRAGPLFLKVRFKVEEEERVEREDIMCKATNFGSKWDWPESKKPLEKDYDEQIADEERMAEEVDKFFTDESSEEFMEMGASEEEPTPATAKDLPNKAEGFYPCARCGSGASRKCLGCEDVNYCSVPCQRLDWVKHKGKCRKVNKEPHEQSNQQKVMATIGCRTNGLNVQDQQALGNGETGSPSFTNDRMGAVLEDTKADEPFLQSSTAPVNTLPINAVKDSTNYNSAPATRFSPALLQPSGDMAAVSSLATQVSGANKSVPSPPRSEPRLGSSSGSASTGYFMHLGDGGGLNTDGSDSVLKGEAKREDDVSSLDSVEEMTSMADAVTPPIDIEPFSLDIDTQCKVELLSFDQHSREAEIMSVEDGVAEVLQSLLQVCRESPGLEENPPTVGQLVAVLGTSGAYIRTKILSIKLSSKQVWPDSANVDTMIFLLCRLCVLH